MGYRPLDEKEKKHYTLLLKDAEDDNASGRPSVEESRSSPGRNSEYEVIKESLEWQKKQPCMPGFRQ